MKNIEKHCKTLDTEPDTFQTVLIENNTYNSSETINKSEDSLKNDSIEFDNFSYFDLFGNRLDSGDCDCMGEKSRFEDERDNLIKKTFGLEDIDEYENFNIMIFPDNRFAMIKRICPHCGNVDANVNEWKERKYKNKENHTVVY